MRRHALEALPVVEAGAVVGLVWRSHLEFLVQIHGFDVDIDIVEAAIVDRPCSVSPDEAVSVAVRRMRRAKAVGAVVVENGKPVGVCTIWDLAMALLPPTVRR